MSLRIVIDSRHIKDFGVGTYIRNLTRALANMDQENHYILIAHRDDVHDFADLPSNFEAAVYDRLDSDAQDNVRFPIFLRRFAADLFHIPLYHVPLCMLKPYIVTVHDLSALLYDRQEGWRNHFRRYRIRRGLLRSEKVIAVSAATRRDVENLLGIPAERIRQIYNAPDPRFSEDPTAARARPAGPKDHLRERHHILERYQIDYPFLLYVGNIRPQKNVPRLIEAFAVLRGHLETHSVLKDLRLIIIGDEISRNPAVRRAAIQSRVEEVVRFLGFVPIDTLRVFYRAASAFAFPSLYEGFGLPPLEAMGAGTPVVTSNVSSLPEVVGDAAVMVNPENVFDIARGLRDVLLDEELRAKLIVRGYAQVKRFSWERTASDVLDTYREVTRTPPAS
jgi:glycosyltransferase involved in cell wall biosynthesis